MRNPSLICFKLCGDTNSQTEEQVTISFYPIFRHHWECC